MIDSANTGTKRNAKQQPAQSVDRMKDSASANDRAPKQIEFSRELGKRIWLISLVCLFFVCYVIPLNVVNDTFSSSVPMAKFVPFVHTLSVVLLLMSLGLVASEVTGPRPLFAKIHRFSFLLFVLLGCIYGLCEVVGLMHTGITDIDWVAAMCCLFMSFGSAAYTNKNTK
ncbi:MAG: hypothetical protein IIY94_09125 [Oscillospiraceae bacterium]|nr:hypothetical protein [Oscillospiraceae bacterium]